MVKSSTSARTEIGFLLDLLQEQIESGTVQPDIVGRLRQAVEQAEEMAQGDLASFAGGGEMGEHIRAFEWAQTPLGPIECWPQSLITATRIMLGAISPVAIYWGADLILLYNDAFRELLGEKHPHALGRPARHVFPEIWETIGPMFAGAMSGRGTAERKYQLLPLQRRGEIENAWFDFSLNPLICEDGTIGGIFNIAAETTDRVRAEEDLRESEEHARRIIDNTVALVGIMTPDGTLIEANATALSAGGLRREEVVGKKFWDCYWWSYDVQVQNRLRAAVAKAAAGHQVRYDEVVRTADDSRMHIDFMLAPVRNDTGDVTHLIPSAVDITERKRMEKSLKKSEATLSLAVEATGLGVFDFYPPTGELIWSDTAKLHFGLPPDAPVDYGVFLRGLHPEDRERVDAIVKGVLRYESGGRYGTEYRTIGISDGLERWLAAHGKAFFNEQKEPVRFIGATVDITERKRGEEALRRSEERLRVAVQNAAYIPAECDRELRYTWIFNPHPDFNPCQVIGKQDVELEQSEGAQRLFDLKRQVLASETGTREEIDFVRSDSRRVYDIILEPLRDSSGAVVGVSSVSFDITESKQAEIALWEAKAAAEEANSAKDTFLINMSHELRTPLAVNMGMLELARSSGGCDQQSLRYLENASSAAESLLNLLENILELRSLQEKTIHLAEAPFDLLSCCWGALHQLMPAIEKKGLQSTIAIDSRLPRWVIGDCDKVEEILLHLIGNAVKFTEQGTIEVTVRAEGRDADGREQVRFKIRDTGIGIPAEKIELIFQPFSQADASLTRRYGGAGLGLAISRELIEQMGGALDVRSAPEGGSVFSFILPFSAAAEESKEASAHREQTERAPGQSARILVVEDDPLVAQMLQMFLGRGGYQVAMAEHGRKALEVLEQEPVDLILMDLKMPVMDGYEATRSIRQREEWRKLPIIALTAHARPEDKAQCLAAGMNDFLSKPIDMQQLYSAIEAHLPSSSGN
jgi:two-component system, chemotaxis family, CheB/CheR fusion protein